MTTFSDAQAPTSRTYVPQQGMNIQILTKNHQLNFSHSFFTLEKIPFWRNFYLWNGHWWLLSVKRVHSLPENI